MKAERIDWVAQWDELVHRKPGHCGEHVRSRHGAGGQRRQPLQWNRSRRSPNCRACAMPVDLAPTPTCAWAASRGNVVGCHLRMDTRCGVAVCCGLERRSRELHCVSDGASTFESWGRVGRCLASSHRRQTRSSVLGPAQSHREGIGPIVASPFLGCCLAQPSCSVRCSAGACHARRML